MMNTSLHTVRRREYVGAVDLPEAAVLSADDTLHVQGTKRQAVNNIEAWNRSWVPKGV